MKPPSRPLLRTLCLLVAFTWLFSIASPTLANLSPKPVEPLHPGESSNLPAQADLSFTPPFVNAILPLGGSTQVSASLENQADQPVDFTLHETPGEIAWLSAQPISGTLPPTSTLPISLTLDTSPLRQPGIFTATLEITQAASLEELLVPITLTVTPPPGWGMLQGAVSTTGYCDQNPLPLPDALLTIQGISETYTTTSGVDGSYAWWLDSAQNPLTVSVTASGYFTTSAVTQVEPGLTTHQDFALPWLQPCLGHSPGEVSVEVGVGYSVTIPARLWNDGHRPASFTFREADQGILPPALPSRAPVFSLPAPPGPLSLQGLADGRLPGPLSAAAPNAWQSAASIPTGMAHYARAQCAEQPDNLYLISGVDPSTLTTNKVFRYDLVDNIWNPLANIPAPVEGAAAACYLGFIYVAGGSGTDQFYVYDIAGDSWAPGPPLPRTAYGAAIGAWQGKLYLLGGSTDFDPLHATPEVDIFDIASGDWSRGVDMPAAVVLPGYAQALNYVYLAGGFDAGFPDANSPITQRFDMASGTWQLGPAFTPQRADLALAATTHHLYAIGGDLSGETNTDPTVEVYVLELSGWPSGSWSDLGDPLPNALSALSAGFCSQTKSGGEIWATGGYSMDASSAHRYRHTGETCPFFSDVPWLSETPQSGELPAGETLDWSIILHAAHNMPLGDYTAQLLLLSDDPLHPTASLPVTMTVAAPGYGIFAGPDQSGSGDPGMPVTYTLLVVNTGNGPTDSYSLTLQAGGWSANLSDASTPPLEPFQTASVQVGITVSPDALAGDQDLTRLIARSTGDPTLVYTALLTTTANPVYGVSLHPGSQKGSALPGGTVAYRLSLVNTGNTTDTYLLTAISGTFTVSLPSTTYTLGMGQAANIKVLVQVPTGILLGVTDQEIIQVQGSGGVLGMAVLQTSALPSRLYLPVQRR